MPPTLFSALVDAGLLPDPLRPPVNELLARKQTVDEDAGVTLDPELAEWIELRLRELPAGAVGIAPLKHPDWAPLNQLFLELLRAQ